MPLKSCWMRPSTLSLRESATEIMLARVELGAVRVYRDSWCGFSFASMLASTLVSEIGDIGLETIVVSGMPLLVVGEGSG